MKNKEELNKAIQVIEEAGGFVMMNDDESDVSHLVTDQEVENEVYKKEYEERKNECFEEFQKMLGSKDFSMSKVDDLLYSHGVDLDDLEDFIHASY